VDGCLTGTAPGLMVGFVFLFFLREQRNVLAGLFGALGGGGGVDDRPEDASIHSLFARLISHQPAVLFSHNKPATS
jgi:hypothetical protein